jgi:hypothetical protein
MEGRVEVIALTGSADLLVGEDEARSQRAGRAPYFIICLD